MGTNYEIVVAGHKGNLNLVVTGNSFSGSFSSPDGDGSVTGSIGDDGVYRGNAYMAGHTVGFEATVDGNAVTGKFHFGFLPISFEGVAI